MSGIDYYHIGICLVKDKVAHYSTTESGWWLHVPYLQKLQRKFKIIITSTNDFLEGKVGEFYCLHPTAPFKHIDKILLQAKKAWWVDYGENKYDLANHQCEHVANSIILGINYSLQMENRKDDMVVRNIIHTLLAPPFGSLFRLARGEYSINNGKGSTICLKNEINSYETNGRFDNLTFSINISDIKEYKDEYQAQIETPIKTSDCIVM